MPHFAEFRQLVSDVVGIDNIIQPSEARFCFSDLILSEDVKAPFEFVVSLFEENLLVLPGDPTIITIEKVAELSVGSFDAYFMFFKNNCDLLDKDSVYLEEDENVLVCYMGVRYPDGLFGFVGRSVCHEAELGPKILYFPKEQSLGYKDITHINNNILKRNICLAIGLIGVIASKSTMHKVIKEPKFTNQKRIRKGQFPILGHTLCTLNMSQEKSTGTGKTIEDRASPRLHWRRGHIRTLSDGRRIPIHPMLIGASDVGIVTKDYAVKV